MAIGVLKTGVRRIARKVTGRKKAMLALFASSCEEI